MSARQREFESQTNIVQRVGLLTQFRKPRLKHALLRCGRMKNIDPIVEDYRAA